MVTARDLNMTLLPPPRAWVDWAVPKDASGDDLGVATDAPTFDLYIHWLADYLVEAKIPLPACQVELLKIYREAGGAEHALFDLSERIGYTLTDVEGIERDFAEGMSWEDFHAHERSCWNDFSEDEQEDQTEEEFFIWREEYERIGREGQEARIVPSHIRHADIPWRPVLAALFREVPDHDRRCEMLRRFYHNIGETASK